jgi:hypothetical protein
VELHDLMLLLLLLSLLKAIYRTCSSGEENRNMNVILVGNVLEIAHLKTKTDLKAVSCELN